MDVPQEIVDVKKSLKVSEKKRTASLKNRNMKKQQNFVTTKTNRKEFSSAKEWQETQKENRVTVNESDIADVVSMMTGILNRVAESEGIRLNNLADQIKEKIVVKIRLLKKWYVLFKEIVQG